MMRCGLLAALPVLILLLDAQESRAQSVTIPPRFEEASVKPTDRCGMQNSIDPGGIALDGDPLKLVLMEAFKVKVDQITGPSWLDEDCFVVTAKIPEGATKDQLPAMFQALLAERFQLAFHKETHLRPGFALVVDKHGTKLKPTEPNANAADKSAGKVSFRFGGGRIKGSITIARLAQLLSGQLHDPVVDETGVQGTYDIDIAWDTDSDPDTPSPTASVVTILRESLGLRLESRKLPVNTIVIDHIKRLPSEN
jgi:uncharacterized protein (TIGR03435 family)